MVVRPLASRKVSFPAELPVLVASVLPEASRIVVLPEEVVAVATVLPLASLVEVLP